MGLNYYADMNDAPVTDILKQANIKTKNNLMDFSNSSWQDCPDIGISAGAYSREEICRISNLSEIIGHQQPT